MKKICIVIAMMMTASVASAALTAKSYIQDGLIAQWDGFENVSYGSEHSNSAAEWKELTGKSPAIPLPEGASFSGDGLAVVRATGVKIEAINAKGILSAFGNANYTAEIAFDKTKETPASTQGYKGKFCMMLVFGTTSKWMGTFGDTKMGINPNNVGVEYNLDSGNYVNVGTTLGKHSFSCSQSGGVSRVLADGTLLAEKIVVTGTPKTDHGFCFNKAWYSDYGLDGIYHSIRFYNRALSEEEVKVNNAVDQVRYFGADPHTVSLPDGWRFTVSGEDVSLEKRLAFTVKNQTGGKVLVNGVEASEAEAIWCEWGTLVDVTITAVPDDGYVFAGWKELAEEVKYDLTANVTVGDKITAAFRKRENRNPLELTWVGADFGDWNDERNWVDGDGLKGAPTEAGDSIIVPSGSKVMMNSSSPLYSFVEVKGTLVMTNWNTLLSANTVNVRSGGILTCGEAVADAADLSRVWISCRDLTVFAEGKIDVSGHGYRGGIKKTNGERGYGPGSGYFPQGEETEYGIFIHDQIRCASPSHGGRGALTYNVNSRSLRPAIPYDDPLAPMLPGSGGFSTTWGAGGNGGGAVYVAASGTVTVYGSICADGVDTVNNTREQPGSGGSVYIVASRFAGSGTISAEGGDGYSSTGLLYALPAGGGCISIEYDSTLQQVEDVTGMKISAACGEYNNIRGSSRVCEYVDWRDSEQGTLHFTDAKILDALLGNGLSGQIKGLAEYTKNGDLDFSWGHVRFASEETKVHITGDVSISGDNVRLEIGGCEYTGRTIYPIPFAGKKANYFSVGGNLTLADKSRLDIRAASTNSTDKFGAFVSVGGTMTIGNGSSVYSWSDSLAPSSPFFSVGSLVVEEGGLFSADRMGGAGGYNNIDSISFRQGNRIPVCGAGIKTCGGGHGGRGGIGIANSSDYGKSYDDCLRPWLPGSGAGAYNDYSVGGAGGGAIIVEALGGIICVDGTISANGENANWASKSNKMGGGGAGGTIRLDCREFVGGENGVLSAKGGSAEFDKGTNDNTLYYCGGGGGGRIAVWCGEPYADDVRRVRVTTSNEKLNEKFAQWFSYNGTATAAGGIVQGEHNFKNSAGGDGSVFFHHIKAPPKDMILRMR